MIASASEADGLYVCFFIIIQQGGIATMNKATCNKVWLAAIAFIFPLFFYASTYTVSATIAIVISVFGFPFKAIPSGFAPP